MHLGARAHVISLVLFTHVVVSGAVARTGLGEQLLQDSQSQGLSSGPSSLGAYCAQAEPGDKNWNQESGYVEGQPVMADWLGFGVYYEARVTGVNSGGSYNVVYDMDGRRERNVKSSDMQPRKLGPKHFNPSKDPACDVKNDVEALDEDLDKANEEVARWLSQRRQKRAARREREEQEEEPGSRQPQRHSAPMPAPASLLAPGPAPAGSEAWSPAPSPVFVSSHHHHIGSGNDDDGLEDVLDCVFDVEEKTQVLAAREVELENKGLMDVELKTAIDDAVNKEGLVEKQTTALKHAVADEKKAHKELREADDNAVAAREDEARLPRHRQHQEAQEKAHADVETADNRVEDCVVELQITLREAKKSVRKFDTSVTPNGAKWWRFRHEYSYVEAGLMLVIVPVMVLYKFIYARLAQHQRAKANSGWFRGLLREIETIHLAWLQYAAGEMFVCFCVVLTIWLLATFGSLDFLVVHITDDDMHLPTAPEQYRIMAVNIAMQLGLAMIAYHILVYSVVRATVAKFNKWNEYAEVQNPMKLGDMDASVSRSMQVVNSIVRGPTLAGSAFEFSQMRVYFVEVLEKSPKLKAKLEEIEALREGFPFGEYLSVSVRLYTDHILELTWGFWLIAWFTFVVFMLLHRFAHVAYVRIMSFFAVALVIVLLAMLRYVQDTVTRMKGWHDLGDDEKDQELQSRLQRDEAFILSREQWMSHLLQFVLFFLCYGFVRMVTAPWLWQIYFYNVLILTSIFLLVMIAFVVVMAPLVPVFYVAMSIPPNISESDVDTIVKTMHHNSTTRSQFVTPLPSARLA